MQILLTVAYDGTNYAGWQRQENAVAVQQKLEEALSILLNRPVQVRSASRTDAGVHAQGQRVCFTAPDLRVPLDKLPMVLVGLLPPDISVTAAIAVPEGFNPRFDAQHKTYAYSVYNAPCPNPLLSRYSAFVPQALNVAEMQKAAKVFVGRHNFVAFCATGSSAKTTVREIYCCSVEKHTNNIITLTVTGNAFLYNMVRILAGTLVYVGMGKISSTDILAIIASKDRKRAGKTMPPEGLVLLNVAYFLDKLPLVR
ncbi:MAG: tRNA pseudouridine(38-40) synthase TruA [Firmicutes bacterium]|nr:tRNA pseudouridine(38-40) synthase TruA [Bacillota bacterium]